MRAKINGLTLIEVMVAIVVVAILAIGAFGYFSLCEKFIVNSELLLTAVNFAAESMEKRYWDGLIGETPNADWTPTALMPPSRIRDLYSGAREFRVTTSTDGSYMIIDTRVTWAY